MSSPLNYWKCKLPTWKIDLPPVQERYYCYTKRCYTMHVRRWSREISTFQYYSLPTIATKAFFYISFCEICSHTQKIEKKNKKCQFVSRKCLGFVCDCEGSLAMIMIKYLDQLTKNWLYFFNMMEPCYLVNVANYRTKKGQKTWELELIDGLSLTCFFVQEKLFFFSSFPFLNTSEKWAGLFQIQPRGRKWLFSGWNKENNRVKSWCRKRIFLPSSASSHHASLLLLRKFWKKMILAKTNLSPALSFHKKRVQSQNDAL